jgi:hypothetical protein
VQRWNRDAPTTSHLSPDAPLRAHGLGRMTEGGLDHRLEGGAGRTVNGPVTEKLFLQLGDRRTFCGHWPVPYPEMGAFGGNSSPCRVGSFCFCWNQVCNLLVADNCVRSMPPVSRSSPPPVDPTGPWRRRRRGSRQPRTHRRPTPRRPQSRHWISAVHGKLASDRASGCISAKTQGTRDRSPRWRGRSAP